MRFYARNAPSVTVDVRRDCPKRIRYKTQDCIYSLLKSFSRTSKADGSVFQTVCGFLSLKIRVPESIFEPDNHFEDLLN